MPFTRVQTALIAANTYLVVNTNAETSKVKPGARLRSSIAVYASMNGITCHLHCKVPTATPVNMGVVV
jgi:hypothetical protein